MKTYAFHSYKGGSGRTLALANFALALRSKGHRVVMIDFDFDAPGLPYKFDKQDEVRGGYIPYLMGTNYQERAQGQNRRMRIDFIRDFLVKIDKDLLLLPAGDPSRVAYWAHLDSADFNKLFSIVPGDNQADGSSSVGRDYWKAFKNDLIDICEAAGNPEYCLVDCKAARSSVAVPLLGWAHHIVEFLHCNYEGVFGMLLLQQMLDTSDLFTKRPAVTPVVTRVPYGTTIQRIRAEIESFAKEMPESPVLASTNFPYEKLQLIVEQRDIEVGDVVVLNNKDRGKHHIAFNYVDLFDSLTDLVSAQEKAESCRALRLDKDDEIVEQIFRFKLSRGELTNKDDKRNVALRKETLVELINSLVDEQNRMLAHKHIVKSRRKQEIGAAFELAGRRAGENFGQEAASTPAVWEENRIPPTVLERLQQWCRFDRAAGFGDWSASYRPNTRKGWVIFKGHFLEGTREEIGAFFVKGYITGVLRYLVGDMVRPTDIKITSSTPTRIEFSHEV